MAKKTALILGVVFVLVGLLAWIPNPLVGAGDNVLFKTNTTHDLVHLLTGLLFILLALFAESMIAMAFKIFGVIYLLVAVLGFIMVPQGGAILGLIETNVADHLLHVVLGAIILALGFVVKGSGSAPMPMKPSSQTPMPGGMGGGMGGGGRMM